jgi:uncharacterized protein
MERPFDVDVLRDRVQRLGSEGRLAFVLSCAERLSPNYSAFSVHHKWGDTSVLRSSIDFGWRALQKHRVPNDIIHEYISRCEAVTPDTEDFDSEYVSAALDAVICGTYVLQLLLDDDSELVVNAASLAHDTVDMYLRGIVPSTGNTSNIEDEVLLHPLMQRELCRQREDVELLERLDLSAQSIGWLLHQWYAPKRSNIGRE